MRVLHRAAILCISKPDCVLHIRIRAAVHELPLALLLNHITPAANERPVLENAQKANDRGSAL